MFWLIAHIKTQQSCENTEHLLTDRLGPKHTTLAHRQRSMRPNSQLTARQWGSVLLGREYVSILHFRMYIYIFCRLGLVFRKFI